jgi:hypothetical protein
MITLSGDPRRGLTTKVHLAADGRCRPLSLLVAAGHRHDSLYFETVMAGIHVPRIGNGRPRTRPASVSADRAYSSRAIRSYLRRRGITTVIPEPADQIANRKRRGCPPSFDHQAYVGRLSRCRRGRRFGGMMCADQIRSMSLDSLRSFGAAPCR